MRYLVGADNNNVHLGSRASYDLFAGVASAFGPFAEARLQCVYELTDGGEVYCRGSNANPLYIVYALPDQSRVIYLIDLFPRESMISEEGNSYPMSTDGCATLS